MFNKTNVNMTSSDLTSEQSSNPVLITTSVFIPICTAIFVLNVLALAVLLKSKKLKKNRFYRLTFVLSISDIIFSITFALVMITNLLLRIKDIRVPYLCTGSTLLTSFTVLFSLILVLFICFERLLATFPKAQANKWSNIYNFLIVGSLVVTGAYCSLIHVLFEDKQSHDCEVTSLFGNNLWKYQLSLGVVHLIIFMSILIVYGLVVRRIWNRRIPQKTIIRQTERTPLNLTTVRHNRISPKKNTANLKPIGGRDQRGRNHANRSINLRNALHTLGFIIAAMVVSTLLPVTVNLMSALTTGVVSPHVLAYVNGLFLINPLCDPIIYVLRIKEFRRFISCSK
ncbi:uncharacterized protein LOC134695159 [Mytilus trossulus]|uniref:uncharacterized protein LOC134695159 n=1 Tax=Mytilus trossulus TaxID=6551 RepID=UPI00300582BB